jgi:hypothetical protein
MSEEVQAKEQQGPSEEEQAVVYAAPDWYLQDLVDLVNGTETGLPMTVFVKGAVISGLLVSGHKFFEGIGEGFTRYLDKDHEHTPSVIENLTRPGKNFLKDRKDKGYPFPYFVHLRSAKVFTPGNVPMPGNGMWWRCRISEVDAFSFGAFMPADEENDLGAD